MPRKRQPLELWRNTRRQVWLRDGGRCQSPPGPHKAYCSGDRVLKLTECHVDHIHSGKNGTNELTNLRVLCRACHALRADQRHRVLTAKAVHEGIIPPDWRPLVWGD